MSANPLRRLIRRVCCFFGRHDYRVTQKMSVRARRIACPHCGGMWGMNDDVRVFIDWDAELHRMYERHLATPVVYLPWEGRPNAKPAPEVKHE